MPFTEKTIEINKTKVSYFDEGVGETILLVHGWLASKETLTPILRKLKSEYRVIAPDLPGFGNTSPLDEVNINSYVYFLRSFINQLKIKKVNIIGNSIGGTIATSFSFKYPHLINTIIARATVIYHKELSPIFASKIMRIFWEYSSQNRLLRDIYAKLISQYIESKCIHNMKECKVSESYIEDLIKQVQNCTESDITKKTARMLIMELLKIDLRKKLKSSKVPTLFIYDSRDEFIKNKCTIKIMNNLPILNIHTTENKTHFLIFDDLDILTKVMSDFIKVNL